MITKPIRGYQPHRTNRLQRDLIGFWLMNEGTGDRIWNFSRSDIFATAINSPGWIGGKFGTGLQFSSLQYVDSGLKSALSGTLLCWFYANSITNGPVLLGQSAVGSGRSYLGITTDGFLGAGIGADAHTVIKGITAIDLTKWYQGAVTWNESNVYLYLNGIQEFTKAQNGAVSLVDNIYFGVGNVGGTPVLYFNGLLDHIRFYSRALSADEIRTLYREPFPEF